MHSGKRARSFDLTTSQIPKSWLTDPQILRDVLSTQLIGNSSAGSNSLEPSILLRFERDESDPICRLRVYLCD